MKMDIEAVRPSFQISSRAGMIGLCVEASQAEAKVKSPMRERVHLGKSCVPMRIGTVGMFSTRCCGRPA